MNQMCRVCRRLGASLLIGFALLVAASAPAAAQTADDQANPAESVAWFGFLDGEEAIVYVHIFWAFGCQYCEEERDFFSRMAARHAWLRIEEYEVSEEPDNLDLMISLAEQSGGIAQSVPTTFIFKG